MQVTESGGQFNHDESMTTQELEALLEADKRGEVEQRAQGYAWGRHQPGESWDFHRCEYRIKPREPREPRRMWVNEYGDDGDPTFCYRFRESADRGAGTARTACTEYVEVLKP